MEKELVEKIEEELALEYATELIQDKQKDNNTKILLYWGTLTLLFKTDTITWDGLLKNMGDFVRHLYNL